MSSGVPEQIGGKWVGYTDFTEFALQGPGAIPAGLTLRGNAFPNAPNAFSIVADGTVGRYLAMTGQDTSGWGVSLDSFDGLILHGEFLARIWIATNTGNRRVLGPMLMNADAPATWDAQIGKIFKRSSIDYESEIGTIIAGSGGQVNTLDMKQAEQAGVWVWCRYRTFEGNPATTNGALLKHWYGEFEDELEGWEASSISYTRPIATALATLLGWGMQAVGNTDEQRIAYFSFTEDPGIAIAPPPGGSPPPPGTPDAPTVIVDPLQDRWVGLEGSAFVVP